MKKSKIANLTTADGIYKDLHKQIIQGKFAPDERLIEENLAESFSSSRTPVRQALGRLAAEGLIIIEPNRGAIVRNYDRDDLLEIYDLRALLEGFAAYKAALNINIRQLRRLEKQIEEMENVDKLHFNTQEEKIQYMLDHNKFFHTIIIDACGNTRIKNVVRWGENIPLQFRSFYWYSSEDKLISDFYHRSIFKALSTREANRAQAMMQEHLYHARDLLLDRIGEIQKGLA